MRIGALDKRVTLQYPTRASDGMGGWTITWTDHATVWAAVWPVSAAEIAKAGGLSLEVTHRIRIRYRAVLRSSWRISWRGRYFDIASIIDPSEAHEWLDLMCKETS